MYLESERNNCKYTYNNYNAFSTVIALFPSIIFYSMFGYYTYQFINYLKTKEKKYVNNKQNSFNNYKYQFSDIDSSYNLTNFKLLNDICLDTSLDTNVDIDEKNNEINKKQTIINNMISSKTLERSLVIYYIFIKKGNYKVKSEITELDEEYNSYLEFKKYDTIFLKNSKKINDEDDDNDDNDNNESISYEINDLFNLDNSLDINTNIYIGTKEYNINQGHLNMISWLYYSGIYEYLTTNIQLKYKILKEMYEDKLLTRSLFLRYQLFLQEQDLEEQDLEEQDLEKQDLENPARKYSENNNTENNNTENDENDVNEEIDEYEKLGNIIDGVYGRY